ncbi:MAG: CYTH domain-containing protein [Bacteroidaceae bacterium]|nr:CYTH domain-containing protein [Bacteroidaceae bacterium]
MAQEIERKFVVKDDTYKAAATSHSRIRQAYIASGNGRTVRVRTRGEKAYITIKGPSADGGLSRYEFETEIPYSDALDLLKIAEPGIIEKERWLVPMPDGHIFEVDEFFGENEGLVMAEVELKSADEAVVLPPFVEHEVTGDRRYYNSHLRLYPYRVWGK